MPIVETIRDVIRKLLDQVGYRLSSIPNRSEIERVLSLITPYQSQIALKRVGPEGDGGYLIPDDTEGLVSIYSPGVANVADFEKHFADAGIPCYLADLSVKHPPLKHDNFFFLQKHLGEVSSDNFMTVAEWIMKTEYREGDLLLQMDIEGAEWDVLASTPNNILERFRIIVVELHDLPNRLSHPTLFGRTSQTLERLHDIFYVAHIHPNNCCGESLLRGIQIPNVVEVTFHRRDRTEPSKRKAKIPHSMDFPNIPGRREPKIPEIWKC
jgi:hypothetical protein